MLGLPPQPPLAHAGQRISITGEGFAPLHLGLAAEPAGASVRTGAGT
jgi:hypothetical protein